MADDPEEKFELDVIRRKQYCSMGLLFRRILNVVKFLAGGLLLFKNGSPCLICRSRFIVHMEIGACCNASF